jgi:hypothetical protein
MSDELDQRGKASPRRRSFAFEEFDRTEGSRVPAFVRIFTLVGTSEAANTRYTTLISRISTSYERNGYYISEFHTPLENGTGVFITVTHIASPDDLGRFATTNWRLERP